MTSLPQSPSNILPWLTIVGIQGDGVAALHHRARRVIEQAALVVGGARHLALAGAAISGETIIWPQPIDQIVPILNAWRGQPVAVLASGDPNWFGVGTLLARHFSLSEMTTFPAPSGFSLACGRLGWALQDVNTISFCGRDIRAVRPMLRHNTRLIALSADETTPADFAALLCQFGFGESRLHILENLSGPDEKIRVVCAKDGVPADISRLNMLALECVASAQAEVLPQSAGLPDTVFEHDGQITKREIRAVTLSSLQPQQGGLLWDIGAGSGSIGIEWMLSHPQNRAIAIESNTDRAARVARNAGALGVPALIVRNERAPDALSDLPSPDAVFIGGGLTAEVMARAWAALRPGGRMVANSVTLESDTALFAACGLYGGQMLRLHIERMDHIGGRLGFRPALPVTQFVARKPC